MFEAGFWSRTVKAPCNSHPENSERLGKPTPFRFRWSCYELFVVIRGTASSIATSAAEAVADAAVAASAAGSGAAALVSGAASGGAMLCLASGLDVTAMTMP